MSRKEVSISYNFKKLGFAEGKIIMVINNTCKKLTNLAILLIFRNTMTTIMDYVKTVQERTYI